LAIKNPNKLFLVENVLQPFRFAFYLRIITETNLVPGRKEAGKSQITNSKNEYSIKRPVFSFVL
jgi:hypothetical protein